MQIIKTEKDIDKLKFGDQYIIDVFPDPSLENQEVTEAMLKKRDDLQEKIEDRFRSKPVAEIPEKTNNGQGQDKEKTNNGQAKKVKKSKK